MKIFKMLGMALLAIIVSVGFIACSCDDDNEETGSNTSLVGKWKAERYDVSVDEKTFDLSNTEVKEVWSYYTFNSDGTGNWLILENTRRYDIQWEVLDGDIWIYFGGSSNRFKVLKSNKNVMLVKSMKNYNAYIKFVRMQ